MTAIAQAMRHHLRQFAIVSFAVTACQRPPAVPNVLELKSTPTKLRPPTVKAPRELTQLEAGATHVCAVRSDGKVWCWGNNDHGQLGDGTTVDRFTAVQVAGIADVVEVRLSSRRTCARQKPGHLSCWGTDENEVDQLKPTQDPRLTDIVQFSMGSRRSCALTGSAKVYCWGDVKFGLIEGLPPVAQIGVGEAHVCARGKDGTAWCWGNNFDRLYAQQPVRMEGLENFVELAVVRHRACAVTASGQLICWGEKDSGQSGDRTQADRDGFALIRMPKVVKVILGDATICGETVDGKTWCSGEGYGIEPKLIGENLLGLALGSGYACAATADLSIRCWGSNWSGQMGNGGRGGADSRRPLSVRGLNDIVQLASGEGYTCGRRRSGSVVCWGSGNRGELGSGEFENRVSPVRVSGLDDAELLYEGSHTCARRQGGKIVCWGSNEHGQIVGNSEEHHFVQPVAMPLPGDTVALGTGAVGSCALLATGQVLCWGDNTNGELGLPKREPYLRPSSVAQLNHTNALALSGGGGCAVRSDGRVACWGTTFNAQKLLDSGSTSDLFRARTVRGIHAPKELALLAYGLCARLANADVVCKGEDSSDSPFQTLFQDAVELKGSGELVCARQSTGRVHCSHVLAKRSEGETAFGAPIEVEGLTDAVELTVGWSHACARRATGEVVCWGEGEHGELGTGDPLRYASPGVEVLGLGAFWQQTQEAK